MEASFLVAVGAVLLIAWAAFDRTVYKGPATVTLADTVPPHWNRKPVFVVAHNELKQGSNVILAFVSQLGADRIARSSTTTHKIIVRRRLFGSARLTYLA